MNRALHSCGINSVELCENSRETEKNRPIFVLTPGRGLMWVEKIPTNLFRPPWVTIQYFYDISTHTSSFRPVAMETGYLYKKLPVSTIFASIA